MRSVILEGKNHTYYIFVSSLPAVLHIYARCEGKNCYDFSEECFSEQKCNVLNSITILNVSLNKKIF